MKKQTAEDENVDQNNVGATKPMIKRSTIPKHYFDDPNNLENIAIFQPTDNMVQGYHTKYKK